MTHRDAPPLTDAQIVFERAFQLTNERRATVVGMSRDKDGNYHATAAQDAWVIFKCGMNYGLDYGKHSGDQS